MEDHSKDKHASHRLRVASEWQARREFDQLCHWWRTQAFGVCSIEGMAGCGKTAVVDRFLRVLPGGYPQLPDVEKADLAPANGIFVFSFFDASEDVFFADLAAWLTNNALDSRPASYGFPSEDPGYGIPSASTASYRQLLSWLETATARHGKLLLVLDGLDRVQDSSPNQDAVGRIVDTPMQNLIVDAADGLLGIAMIITTRYPLVDVVKARAKYLHTIEVGELSPEGCCSLLRSRGVSGDDEELLALSRAHGFHAFSLDLLGGYIAEYCSGEIEQLYHRKNAVTTAPRESALYSVVQRYRHMLSGKDPAALAILERLCLFRNGVTATRLSDIFLRKNLFDFAKKGLSGAALARLSAGSLQAKLSGLLRMRLILESQVSGGVGISVHPALRDALVSDIDPGLQVSIHKAVLANAGVRKDADESFKTKSFGDLEGLIYHALGAGLKDVAWSLYYHQIADKDWSPQGYHREERLCRAIAAGEPDTLLAPADELLATLPAGLTFAWGNALGRLGRLDNAATCFKFLAERTEDPKAYTRLYDVWLKLGRIQMVLGSLEHWISDIMQRVRYGEYNFIIPLATLLDELTQLRGYARSLAGNWETGGWRGSELLSAYVRVPPAVAERPLTGIAGIHHVLLQLRLGNVAEAVDEAHIQEQFAGQEYAETDETAAFWMRFRLLQAEIALKQGNLAEALDLQQQGYAWAAARDANEVLCWSHLLRARIELEGGHESLAAAMHAADSGLRIARSCGFALLHIDLLIVRAQASLSAGRPQDAERDLVLAVYGESTRPEDVAAGSLVSANSQPCRYAWGIVEATHWRGVACLVQAAQILQSLEFDPAHLDNHSESMRAKLAEGAEHLQLAIEGWKKLEDSVSQDVDLGEATRTVLAELEQGRLPRFPLQDDAFDRRDTSPPGAQLSGEGSAPAFDVFLSYNSDDRELVREVAVSLKQRDVKVWFDQWEIKPGKRFLDELDKIIRDVQASAVFIGASGIGPWQTEEIYACLHQSVHRGQAVIPVLLPNALKEPELPGFLQHRTRVDLRAEFGFDNLMWALKGVKPQH